MSNLIAANRIRVSVGHQIFEIPAERVSEVINLLSRLQSIQVSEGSPQNTNSHFSGQTLIYG